MDVLGIDRVVFVTSDIEETGSRFGDLLGLSFGEPRPAQSDENVLITYSQPGLELMQPRSEETPVAEYLAREGPGVWGLVFRVADLDTAVAELAAQDVEPIEELDIPDAPEVMYHPSEFGGVLTVLTEYPHPLDWETNADSG